MIRINLLPVRAAKKREFIRFQLTVAGLITLFVLSVSIAYYLTVKSDAAMLATDIENGRQELRQLRRKIGELSRIKEQKRLVEEKLRVIAELEKARTGPTSLFKMISEAIPREAWLKSLKDEGSVVTLTGYAATDSVVAEFMRQIERRHRVGAVELVVAKRVKEAESGEDVVSFIIKIEK